ncbi:diaminopimelate epimerase [Candidatus Margulisiibacteriota bacterium]
MNFVKLEGLGNDFVLIDGQKEKLEGIDLNSLAIKICDRHFGIGADGLLVVTPSKKADIQMRVFNPDGSEPEMCGNGIRCAAKYVYETAEPKKELISVETLAGVMLPSILEHRGDAAIVEVDMGTPVLKRSKIPMRGKDSPRVIGEDLKIDGETFTVTCVSMGNPHCVIFVDDINKVELGKWGPKIESHSSFPKRTNVEFAQAVSNGEAIVKVWERGAGETLACGTGACATLVAGVLNNKLGRKAIIDLPGGKLECEWIENDHVLMRGPAMTVFTGKYHISA